MAFNPHDGDPGDLPSISKATLAPGIPAQGNTLTGKSIAYARMVFWLKCGPDYTALRPGVNWGPWAYNAATQQAVANMRALFGMPAGYGLSENDGSWDVVDFIWAL